MSSPPPPAVAQAVLNLPSSAFAQPALINPGQEPGQLDAPETESGLPGRGSAILMDSLEQMEAALPGYAEAEQFYDGDIGDIFSTEKVRELLARAGVYEVEDFNYAKVPVDAIMDKLQIRAVTCSAGKKANDNSDPVRTTVPVAGGTPDTEPDEGKQVAERAQEIIDDLRTRNQLDAEEEVLHERASKHGDAYLFVWPVTEALDEDEDEDTFEGGIQLDGQRGGKTHTIDMFVNTATTVRVFYDPENPLRITHAIKTWEWYDDDADGAKVQRATLYFPDRVERWISKPREDTARPESWVPFVVDGQEWPMPNPVGVDRVPFFHFRTSRTYGKPEHKAAYGPQRLINKLISAHAATIDFQSFPQRYALSNPKADEVLSNLIDPDFPEDEDDDPEGAGHSQLRADPSAVWKLPGIASVGQFQPADPGVFLQPLDRYIRASAELTGTPPHRYSGFTTPPSGEALTVANEPLNKKADNRQKAYGATWADAYEFALRLMGITDVTVAVQWAPTETATGAEDWNIVAAKIANGVPVLQALVEAGYPQDQVQRWLSDETGADLVRRVALLNSIGTAVQTLGAGVGLGVVSAEQVGGIVSRILGVTAEDLPMLEEPVELHPAQQQLLDQMDASARNRQVAEHTQENPPPVGPDKQGNMYQTTPPALPEPPPPTKPIQVGV